MAPSVTLRPVAACDLPIFFEHELDPEANEMAVYPARERDTFMAHWNGKILSDPAVEARTVVADGRVAGNLVSWTQDGVCFVGYWIGREFWGRGIATAALSLFLQELPRRPLTARVSTHNFGSIRVLQKCGFIATGEDAFFGPDGRHGEEFIFTLASSDPTATYFSPACSMPEIED